MMMGAATHLKALVPAAIKDPIKEAIRARRFKQAISAYRALSRSQTPSKALLQELVAAWGNEGWSAHHEYLNALVEATRSIGGPIIECGSGLSTLLVGIEAGRRGLNHYALEHNSKWAARIRRELELTGLDDVVVCEAPLKSYGAFSWYDVSGLDLPRSFAMAICDGPPGDTPGGRYGLVPVMGERLASGALLMIDDFERSAEQMIANRWAKETGGTLSQFGSSKPYAILKLP